jgi:hypothetical protein
MPVTEGWNMEDPKEPMAMSSIRDPETGGQARQGDENNRQQEAYENEAAGGVAVRQVAHRRLHDKGQQARHPGDGPHLGQGKPQLFDKQGKQGAGEGAVEIPGEMDQGQGEQDFGIGLAR